MLTLNLFRWLSGTVSLSGQLQQLPMTSLEDHVISKLKRKKQTTTKHGDHLVEVKIEHHQQNNTIQISAWITIFHDEFCSQK